MRRAGVEWLASGNKCTAAGLDNKKHVWILTTQEWRTDDDLDRINQSIDQSIESLLTQPAHYLKASKAQRA